MDIETVRTNTTLGSAATLAGVFIVVRAFITGHRSPLLDNRAGVLLAIGAWATLTGLFILGGALYLRFHLTDSDATWSHRNRAGARVVGWVLLTSAVVGAIGLGAVLVHATREAPGFWLMMTILPGGVLIADRLGYVRGRE